MGAFHPHLCCGACNTLSDIIAAEGDSAMVSSGASHAQRPTAADSAFQEWFWTAQRFAWALLVLVIVAALAGTTGRGGVLSKATAVAGSARIEYPAVARWQTADGLRVTIAGTAPQSEILLPASFLDRFEIETVTPQPAKVTAGREGARYAFDLDPSARPASVRFAIRAREPDVPATPHRF
jgi:hypothetical protein